MNPVREETYNIYLMRLFKIFSFKDLKKAFHKDMLNQPEGMLAFRRIENEFCLWDKWKWAFGRGRRKLKKTDLINVLFSFIKTKGHLYSFLDSQYGIDDGLIRLVDVPQSLQKVLEQQRIAKIKALNKKGIPKELQQIIIRQANYEQASGHFSTLNKFKFKECNFGAKTWIRNRSGRIQRTPSKYFEERERQNRRRLGSNNSWGTGYGSN